MKNKPKSAVCMHIIFNKYFLFIQAFVPPRLVPKPEPPSPPVMSTLERHNPHQWGFAGMTTAMKRSAYDDDNYDHNSSHVPKITKSSNFIPPAFYKPEPIQSEQPQQQSFSPPAPPSSVPTPQQPGLLNDALISRLLNNSRPPEM
jgi:hypothetical protein